MVSSIGDSSNVSGLASNVASSAASGLFEAYLENFISRFQKIEDDSKTEMINDLMTKADSDKSGGISLDELKTVDVSNNINEKDFKNTLLSQFSSLDKNKDGELSIDEMKEALKQKRFSIQELSEMEKDFQEGASNPVNNKVSSSSFEATLLNM